MKSLQQLRKKINTIDKTIIKHIATRMKLSDKIGKLKAKSALPIIDKSREKKLETFHKKLSKQHQLSVKFINQLFKLIVIESRKMQKSK